MNHSHGPLAETSQEELIEARERTDAGIRLACPYLFDREKSASFVPPALDSESAQRVSSKLLDAEVAIKAAGREIPLEGEQALHKQLNGLVNQIGDIGAVLAERFGS